jgi:hypothetical protein
MLTMNRGLRPAKLTIRRERTALLVAGWDQSFQVGGFRLSTRAALCRQFDVLPLHYFPGLTLR